MARLCRGASFSTVLLVPVLLMIMAGCGNTVGHVDEEIDVTLLDSRTEPPSKIRLFFQVDETGLSQVSALDQPDFEIYENGDRISELESQARIRRERGEFLYSSVLLLDLSGSILNNQDLPRLKEAASSFIEKTIPTEGDPLHGTREMALYWFDGAEEIHLLVPYTEERNNLLSGIAAIDEEISDDMSTNLNGAVIQGLTTMDSRLEQVSADSDIAIAGSMVLFTDGTDQAARVSTSDAVSAVNNAILNHSVFTIGLGGEIDEVILSSFGKNGFEMAADSLELKSSFLAVAEQLERQANSYYVLEYCSPKRAGEHTLELVALHEEVFGSFETTFSADGFAGGCRMD